MPDDVNIVVEVDSATAICANHIAEIENVSNNIEKISEVTDYAVNVAIVAGSIDKVNAVGNNINAVTTVASSDNLSNIDNVSDNIIAVNNVSSNMSDVKTVSNNATTLVSNMSSMVTIAGDLNDDDSNIKTVASNISNVNKVGAIDTKVSSVADNETNINTVATDLASPNSAIKNAISAASTASTKATQASQSAYNATSAMSTATTAASTATLAAEATYNNRIFAEQAAQAAHSSMTTAVTKATQAVSSASTASTQATIATSAMTTATTAATTATQKATAAATSESNARTYASTATAQADKAEQQASLARRYAQETHGASDVTFSNLRALPAINNYEYPQTDEDGLNDLIEEYRSTFDLSKFTVVGSPIVTNDGIFTGASSSALTFPINITNGQETVVNIKYKHKNNSNPQFLFCTLDNNENSKGLFIYADTNNDINVFYNDTTHIVDNFDLIENTEYAFELKTDYKTYVALIIDGVEKYNATGLSLAYGANNNAILGNNVVIANNRNILGSLDLKQFSITVDGVEVFSGNKTGIDTIKPDDYTVVGSPTISADGIASGFSGNNYITIPSQSLTYQNDWEVVSPVFSFSTTTTSQSVCMIGESSSRVAIAGLNNGKLLAAVQIPSTSTNILRFDNISYSANTKYQIKIKHTASGVYSAYLKTGDGNFESMGSPVTDTTTQFNTTNLAARIGYQTDNANPFSNGSIDLNSFKIYVNGDLVYQPCLKIPYTLSKTGSKIVDSIYRDRVNDMYEQFGYAPYFTLKEDGINEPNYTKVNNPTLVDGIASGFSSNDYFTTPLTFAGAWEFNCKFNVSEWNSNDFPLALISATNELTITQSKIVGGGIHFIWHSDFPSSNDYLKTNTNYLLTINYDGVDTYTTTVKNLDNNTIAITKTITSSTTFASGTNTWRIGASANNTAFPFSGSVNLDSLKIEYDPVTESEILNNFTVPQGSTYGYLQKLTRQNVTDTTSTSVTLAKAKGNTDYHYGTLTSLTITANETSDYETNIYFTAGNSISVSLPATLDYIGTTPSFSANESYVMSILNNILVIGEIA